MKYLLIFVMIFVSSVAVAQDRNISTTIYVGDHCINGNDPIVIQAETGVLSGCSVGDYFAGFHGTGYVTGFNADGDTMTLTFNAECAGEMDLSIRATLSSTKNISITLNGETVSSNFALTGQGMNDNQWVDATVGNVNILSGSNTITLERLGTYQILIDEITFQ